MIRTLATVTLMLGLPALAAAGPWGIVAGGKTDQANVVCTIPLQPGDPAAKVRRLQLPDGSTVHAQLVNASLHQEKGQSLVFVLTKVKAGEKIAIGPVEQEVGKP